MSRVKRVVVLVAGVLWVVSVVAVVWAATQARAQREVRAERFVLVDAQGKARAVLGGGGDWWGLPVLDRHGNARAALVLAPTDTPVLQLTDRTDHDWARTDIEVTGNPAMALRWKRGERRAVLSFLPSGKPSLEFVDEHDQHQRVVHAP
jgi:hypothetical protein